MTGVTNIGWFLLEEEASHAFFDPVPLKTFRSSPLSPKAVQACPAVNEFETRAYVIRSPYSIDLRFEQSGSKVSIRMNVAKTSLSKGELGKVLTVNERQDWRAADRPVIQLKIPYLFVSDDDVYLNQIPQTLRNITDQGHLICGRFPIRSWIRPLSFAMEFERLPAALSIRRGDPLCYVVFETKDPSALLRIGRAKRTEALTAFTRSCLGVTSKIRNTFSAIETAESRRPKKLLEWETNE